VLKTEQRHLGKGHPRKPRENLQTIELSLSQLRERVLKFTIMFMV